MGSADFSTMVNFLQNFLVQVHNPSTIDNVVNFFADMGCIPLYPSGSVKDWCDMLRCGIPFDVTVIHDLIWLIISNHILSLKSYVFNNNDSN